VLHSFCFNNGEAAVPLVRYTAPGNGMSLLKEAEQNNLEPHPSNDIADLLQDTDSAGAPTP
jgi:hypothetical protein